MQWLGEQLWRVAVAIVGWSILVVGVVLFPTPLPFGIVLVPLGLLVLATEFRWARRLRRKVVRQIAMRTAARGDQARTNDRAA